MKSLNNRYRPPRMQYKLDDWTRKKNVPVRAPGPKSKKNKRGPGQ
jgi:hypothetical protein